MRLPTVLLVALLALVVSACASPGVNPAIALMQAHKPRSILVLPPRDNTLEVDASYRYLPTVSWHLAERGFYVFPVAVVDRLMRENGLPGPHEMHEVSPAKLREVFGADAVLYLTLQDWGTRYQVLQSVTRVQVDARLVDLRSGVQLWSASHAAVDSSGDGGGGLAGLMLQALMHKVASSVKDNSAQVAESANYTLFGTLEYRGGQSGSISLPPGPYRTHNTAKPARPNAAREPSGPEQSPSKVSGNVKQPDKKNQ